ncbi:MAG: hypothetical protein ACLRYE_02335 [Gemmiger formicilis]|uniref:hypothetical protein n=1 Tax=Gemmiger formicilis TaxID=745368 RepID=UPI0039A05C94
MNGWPIWMGLWCSAACWQAEPLRSLHAALAADEDALTGAVAAFEAALFARGTNWTEALLDAVLEEENLCLRVAAGQDAGPVLETALNSELDFLQTLGRAPLDEVFPARQCSCRGGRQRPTPTTTRPMRRAVRPWARRATACLPATMSLRWRTGIWCRCATPTRSV